MFRGNIGLLPFFFLFSPTGYCFKCADEYRQQRQFLMRASSFSIRERPLSQLPGRGMASELQTAVGKRRYRGAVFRGRDAGDFMLALVVCCSVAETSPALFRLMVIHTLAWHSSSPLLAEADNNSKQAEPLRLYPGTSRCGPALVYAVWSSLQTTLIGALGPLATPICLNSKRVSPIIHGLFLISAVRVKQMGVTGGPDVPITVARLRPFFPHDDTHPFW
ncbi:hypothetical protein Y032_0064g3551 [Ancylostoma ceylanicum]|uniref:Secreted protein n=1 Tax=Ancylostoma ceylanicum TaxID=53326 RepID=A0A016U137_9BILA|nr:hypothetical protein Y032_0064g3551 [Ancylostoma ceylanicum]